MSEHDAPRSEFVWITCHVGSEAWLKADLAAHLPQWRPAFARPGFVSFKADTAQPAPDHIPSPFARVWAASLAQVSGDDLAQVAAQAAQTLRELGACADDAVHLFWRDRHPPERPPREDDTRDLEAAASQALADALGSNFKLNQDAREGQRVFSCVIVDPQRWWIGAHTHHSSRRPSPGGRPPHLDAPADAPSRVWLKIEEALWWSKAPIQPGDLVLDLGCAPGGGTWALLARGARVLGVDPAQMAPQTLAHPNFTHRAAPFEHLSADNLPADTRWIVFDVNLAPPMTLKALARLGRALPELRGAIITLKLNDRAMAARIPWMLQQLERMGLTHTRAAQLVHNRREICVVGLTARGVAEASSATSK